MQVEINAPDGRKTRTQILVEALSRPMTGSELLGAMQPKSDKIQLRVIWLLLKNLQKQELVFCLNPKDVTGRLYYFTEKGKKWVGKSFGITVEPLPRLVNWKKYSYVVRGQARREVLVAMQKPWRDRIEKTATEVRKLLPKTRPVGLADAIKLLHGLEQQKLIRRVGFSDKKTSPLYQLTTDGEGIVTQLQARNQSESSPPKDVNALPSILLYEEEFYLSNGEQN